jgi:1-acyl-sn-glycerol-3-phosphate acyltransferase
MLRTLYVAVVFFLATLVTAPLVIAISLIRSHAEVIDRLIRLWAATIVRSAGIELSIENRERLSDDRRYVLVANHHSYFDIPCLLAAVPQPIRFMAKASLFKIPLFGWSLRASGFIPIDRRKSKTAVSSFKLAAARIRKGNTIVVFPEAGRSREKTMMEFQRGAFLLAMNSGLPIVPVAIVGAYEVMPATRWSVHPGPVVIRLGHPIETDHLTVRAKNELIGRARHEIETMLEAGT